KQAVVPPIDRGVSKGTTTLLEQLMPQYDFGNYHALVVPAPRAVVAAAVETYRLDGSPLISLLFRLRGLGPPHGTLRSGMIARGFAVLAEEPGEEVVLGITGQFWALNEPAYMRSPGDASAFMAFNQPGWAKAAANIRLEPR